MMYSADTQVPISLKYLRKLKTEIQVNTIQKTTVHPPTNRTAPENLQGLKTT